MSNMANGSSTKVDGLLFDKDGTLFDFSATWDAWAHNVMTELSAGNGETLSRLAAATHFDMPTGRILPSSPVIASTNREVAELMTSVLPGRDVEEVEDYLEATAAQAPLAPAVPLAPFLQDLAGRGLALGVMTNDCEFVARAQLKSAGVEAHFDFIAGFDSGFGGKPSPDPLLAFASATSLDPGRVAMVGDSTHDLIAGRAAGMQTIAVLTGLAETNELAPYADVILRDIGHIPAWLAE